MSEPTECLAEQVLLDYVAGRLAEEERRRIEEHLSGCQKCRDAASWIEANLLLPLDEDETEQVPEIRQEPSPETYETEASVTEPFGEAQFDINWLAPPNDESSLGRLGNHDIQAVVGYGGMGVVFKAYDERLRRIVAIKALNRGLASSSTARRRFIREARAAAAINHPNVITIHAVEDHFDQPFLVMEYVDGGSLRDRLRREKRLDPIEVLRLGSQIAAGLAAAHAQGVIHRDVKPGNIMLENALERVKITDFGLARVAIDNVELTSRGLAVGTPAYMAPEQVTGDKIDSRADLFALGCVMYAMLAGHSPFHGKHALEVAHKVKEHNPPALGEIDERTPQFLSEIVMRLLEKDADRRFQSAMELANVLNDHLVVLNQTPTDELKAVLYDRREKQKSAQRWPVLTAAAAGVVLCVLLIISGAIMWNRKQADDPPVDQPSPDTIAQPKTIEGPLTVAQTGEAQFRSINDALKLAGPDAEIRVLDGAVYDENLTIDNADKWQGIRILGVGSEKPTIAAAKGTAISIVGTPGVLVNGIKIQLVQEQQHAIVITGESAGVTVEAVQILAPATVWALIYVKEASGTSTAPIRIMNSRFESPCKRVVVDGGVSIPGEHVQVSNNRFVRPEIHLQLKQPDVQFNQCVRSVEATGNVFEGTIGVALGLADDADGVLIANNTFRGNERWLDLRSSPPYTKNVVIANNLVIESQNDAVHSDRHPISDYVEHWQFDCNYWELDPSSAESVLNDVAELHPNIELLSRDPMDERQYLRLPHDSPLTNKGLGDDLPDYVGAFSPDDGETSSDSGSR